MTQPTPSRFVEPPARHLRLLADLAPGAAVTSGLLSVWLLVTTGASAVQLVGGQTAVPGLWLRVVGLLVGLAAAAVTGLVAYRLGVEAPRTVRAWNRALAERVQVLRDR